MSNLALKQETIYTYENYLNWPEDERWEILEGRPYNMSPAPNRKHQKISRQLLTIINTYLKGKTCEVYDAPFDVRLPEINEKELEIKTVVQPDIVVVCDPSKLDDKGCIGAPDLVIEILSPHTAKRDIKEKYDLYEKFGVKEYWIVYPNENVISVHKLGENNQYIRPEVYGVEDKIKVGIFEDLEIDLQEVFAE